MKINHRRKNKQRKAWTGSKTFDRSCRNHGSCSWCRSNRTHKHKRHAETPAP